MSAAAVDTSRTAGAYSVGEDLPLIPDTRSWAAPPDGRWVAAITSAGGGYAARAAMSTVDTEEASDAVADGPALALLVQGLTAWHLLHGSAALRPGETVVIS